MTDVLHIRTYAPPDEAAVTALWHACHLVVPHNNPKHDIALKAAHQPDLFFVGELDGEVVATAMVGWDGHRGWLNYVAVTPDLQRQDIGQRLMDHVETKLRALGCPKINLQVRAWNSAAIAFYERLGYAVDLCYSMGKKL